MNTTELTDTISREVRLPPERVVEEDDWGDPRGCPYCNREVCLCFEAPHEEFDLGDLFLFEED